MVKQSIYRKLIVCRAGKLEYQEAWNLQAGLLDAKKNGFGEDVLLLLEHPHTYTLGKVAKTNHLLLSEEQLRERNIRVFEIDRGGDITYHGPGQLVGYPILDLKNWKMDSHLYLRTLEDVLIKTLETFRIFSGRNEGLTGVWCNEKKIAAIGIKISSWITMHGFALNVSPDLEYFSGIIPCGITDKPVTSMQLETGDIIAMDAVAKEIAGQFAQIFTYNTVENVTPEQLMEKIEIQEKANV